MTGFGATKIGRLLIALFVATVVLPAIGGCSLNRGPLASAKTINDFYCGSDVQPGAYVPVRWSKSDTDETIAQVKANNAVYVEICR